MNQQAKCSAIYARQSVERDDSLSIEGQLTRCRFECEQRQCREYIDRGFSGKNTNRPAFQQMMQDIRAGKIGRVVVYRLDRISRSILDFAQMMELFEEKKVEFLSSTEHFDTSLPMGRAMLNICIVFAQLERETIQSRVLDTYADRSCRGFYMGGRVPYGFALDQISIDGIHTACYVPNEEEVQIVKRIFDLYAAPEMTLGELARVLRAQGWVNRSGKFWSGTRLAELLQNPIYCRADESINLFFKEQGAEVINTSADFIGQNGCYLFSGTSINKRRTLAGTKLVIAPHKGLVSSFVWLSCRKKLMKNQTAAPAQRGKSSWLCGLVRCAKCGYALRVAKSKSAAARYFICAGKAGAAGCEGLPTIYAEELEQTVKEQLLGRVAALSAEYTQGQDALRAREHQLDEEMQVLANRAMQATGALMRVLSDRAEQISAQLEEVRAQLQTEGGFFPVITSAQWEGLKTQEQQQVLACFVEGIYAGNDTLEMRWQI